MAVGLLVAPLVWSMVSDRPDFGDFLDGHHPPWIVACERRRNARVLFAFAGDGAWWLDSMSGGQPTWSLGNQTPEFGERLDGRHAFWIGNFTGVAPCGRHRALT